VALQGTLETFALSDVLRLLASTKKSGALRIDTARGHGELLVRDGELVSGVADSAPRATSPPDVLFEMLRSVDGSFVFDADAAVAEGDAQDVESVLAEAEAQLAEWSEIEAVVPSPRRQVSLRRQRDDDISFSAAEWSVVATIGGGCTVSALAERLDASEIVATRAVRDLVIKDAVELSDTDVDDAAPLEAPAAAVPSFETPAPSVPSFETPAPSVPSFENGTRAMPSFENGTEAPAMPSFENGTEAPAMPSFENGTEAPVMPMFGSDSDSFLSDDPAPLPTREPRSESPGFAPAADEPMAPVAPLFRDEAPAEAPPAAAPAWTPSDFGDDSSSFFDDEDEDPLAGDPFGPDPFRIPKLPTGDDGGADDTEAAEMARQLQNLSPRAAQAVAAAARATTDEERDQALAQAEAADGDDGVNRGLLLKFLSTVDE
jgi:Domain of unknown function (DUF4388)